MFAAVPALYALGAISFAALAAINYATGNPVSAFVCAVASPFFAWCTYVCIKRSRGE